MHHIIKITPELLLKAYRFGVFPMAESKDDKRIMFIDPDHRGIIPLDAFHIPRKLKKLVKKRFFEVTYNQAFHSILAGCAEINKKRKNTWINLEIMELYQRLFDQGKCHSVEVWLKNELAGGLYGVALGGAFFGESMYSIYPNASKVGLVHLIAALRKGGFSLLDSQFITEHLSQFGAIEITRDEYHEALSKALQQTGIFPPVGNSPDLVHEFLQFKTQTS
ncbi:MAG: leucyl/phenylalanyl-tRNA--protein transferase [Rhodospirillaceae bacterium]|nr:leucyl/phenylalanyl-tRNA--protein transferase [Rhodospirillaceae bacterium]|tara:strand:+ start:2549 stop:3211 length:663 start_codon:yes stop_codon:yes gene_type:complete